MILSLALVLSVIYNAQSGIGVWSSVSLVTVLVILVLGSIAISSVKSLKSVSLLLLVGFIFTLTGIMIAYNFIFYNKLPRHLKEGYWTPILTTNIFHGIFLILSLIAIVMIGSNIMSMDNTKIKYYDNAFSIVVTLVLLNAGLMAGA